MYLAVSQEALIRVASKTLIAFAIGIAFWL